MVREFKLPDVGEGVTEGELLEWHVEVGDPVEEDQVVAEVETDKAVVDVPSPVNGTVRELRAEPGEVVPVGTVIITFDVEGEEPEPAEAGGEAKQAAGDEETAAGEGTSADEAAASNGESGGRVFAAPSARRLARELDVDIGSVEGSGPGGRVTEGDVRAAAESGSSGGGATADAGASESGDGEKQLKSAVTRISDDDGASAASDAGSASGDGQRASGDGQSAGGTAGAAIERADRDRTLAAPATRQVAAELDVDIDQVPTDETRDGEAYVDEAAVREYAEAQQRAQAADAAAMAEAGGETADAGDGAAGAGGKAAAAAGAGTGAEAAAERERREPYRGVRKTIGEAMERSKFTAPHVTHHDKMDATALVELRERLKPRAEERGVRLTYMPFVMKAVAAALKDHPVLNTTLDEDNEEVVYKNYYNIGVAAATDAGLMVPVVEDVDRKGLLQIASETNERVQKARDRSISRGEMQGGTFTITNFGVIGGEYASPIINYPETAILGLGSIEERPVAVDGEVVARETLTVSLSIDHRVIDGADAARFVNTFAEYIEDPSLLLLE